MSGTACATMTTIKFLLANITSAITESRELISHFKVARLRDFGSSHCSVAILRRLVSRVSSSLYSFDPSTSCKEPRYCSTGHQPRSIRIQRPQVEGWVRWIAEYRDFCVMIRVSSSDDFSMNEQFSVYNTDATINVTKVAGGIF